MRNFPFLKQKIKKSKDAKSKDAKKADAPKEEKKKVSRFSKEEKPPQKMVRCNPRMT